MLKKIYFKKVFFIFSFNLIFISFHFSLPSGSDGVEGSKMMVGAEAPDPNIQLEKRFSLAVTVIFPTAILSKPGAIIITVG